MPFKLEYKQKNCGGDIIKYFNYVSEQLRNEIFYKEPEEIDNTSNIDTLRYALGATLYMPATRSDIADMIIEKKYPQMMSLTICLEDSIKDDDVCKAEETLVKNLELIDNAKKLGNLLNEDIPFLFIRVRTPEHLKKFAPLIENYRDYVTGFVFPKFDIRSGQSYIDNLEEINSIIDNKTYYFMPILESEDIIYVEKRRETLNELKNMLEPYKDLVLNIRMGATDFCSLFGLRRGEDYTVYQIQVVRDCISDILNFFSRRDQSYVVSGSVWEYFESNNRFLKPLLRVTPFSDNFGKKGVDLRSRMIENNLDGLIREILEDKENGIVGKTVIHPSHIVLVNSLYVVTHEEYIDALEILNRNNSGGVFKSEYNNKMNEVKPHTLWAKKILLRAKVYGVYNENYDSLALVSPKSY
ncbi:MAG: HpcH/HpaI aldolase/citrate lyase family protein [Acidaminobacteraceae bacterium]